MDYLACMLAGVIISGAGRKIYMRYKQHKRRLSEERRRLISSCSIYLAYDGHKRKIRSVRREATC